MKVSTTHVQTPCLALLSEKVIHVSYLKWSQSIAIGVDFPTSSKSVHTRKLVIHEIHQKKFSCWQRKRELLAKAMNNKVLKSTDENINMNFLYVCFGWKRKTFLCSCVLEGKFMDQFMVQNVQNISITVSFVFFSFSLRFASKSHFEWSRRRNECSSWEKREILNMICVHMANLWKAVKNVYRSTVEEKLLESLWESHALLHDS